MGHFGTQSHHFRTFLEIFSLEFSEIVPDKRHLKCVKLTILDFSGKFLLCPNRVIGVQIQNYF